MQTRKQEHATKNKQNWNRTDYGVFFGNNRHANQPNIRFLSNTFFLMSYHIKADHNLAKFSLLPRTVYTCCIGKGTSNHMVREPTMVVISRNTRYSTAYFLLWLSKSHLKWNAPYSRKPIKANRGSMPIS